MTRLAWDETGERITLGIPGASADQQSASWHILVARLRVIACWNRSAYEFEVCFFAFLCFPKSVAALPVPQKRIRVRFCFARVRGHACAVGRGGNYSRRDLEPALPAPFEFRHFRGHCTIEIAGKTKCQLDGNRRSFFESEDECTHPLVINSCRLGVSLVLLLAPVAARGGGAHSAAEPHCASPVLVELAAAKWSDFREDGCEVGLCFGARHLHQAY